MGEWDGRGQNPAKFISTEGDKNSPRATSERVVVENSSQDVSAFAAIGARVGIVKVELAGVISVTIVDGMGDEPSGKWKLKMGEASSNVVTEDDDGDGGGTMIGWGLREEHRISQFCSVYG